MPVDRGAYKREIEAAKRKFVGSRLTGRSAYVHYFRPSERLIGFGQGVSEKLRQAFGSEFFVSAFRTRGQEGKLKTNFLVFGSIPLGKEKNAEDLVKELSREHKREVPRVLDVAAFVTAAGIDEASDFFASRALHNREQLLNIRRLLLNRLRNEYGTWEEIRKRHDPSIELSLSKSMLYRHAANIVENVFNELEAKKIYVASSEKEKRSRKSWFIDYLHSSLPQEIARTRKKIARLGSIEQEIARTEAALKKLGRGAGPLK
ncbi:hypothetical protein HY991_02745 [Candidatus Micrarchaeota archaeon]|nr:hypothetical protein [Candidatus Micrarchaeota archaeon]